MKKLNHNFSIYITSIVISSLLLFTHCQNANSQLDTEQGSTKRVQLKNSKNEDKNYKHKGAHVFGISDSTNFKTLKKYNIEWVTLVSWGFQDDYDSTNLIHHNRDSTQILQHNLHWVERIKFVKAQGFKVFFKPHVWLNNPTDKKWRSDIFPTNDKNWTTWKTKYRDFIIRYAKIAEEAEADMFCIGTEFSLLATKKPKFWISLIEDVRKIYSGKLTYAANWNKTYKTISFWNHLDYIGVQAYFPLTKVKNPSIQQISNGWQTYLPDLATVSNHYNKKILFTEMGYRSTESSAIRPWDWMENSLELNERYSAVTQANCYEAFFNEVWHKEWFAGVHLWQIRTDYKIKENKTNLDFTPQGKAAERIISQKYK